LATPEQNETRTIPAGAIACLQVLDSNNRVIVIALPTKSYRKYSRKVNLNKE